MQNSIASIETENSEMANHNGSADGRKILLVNGDRKQRALHAETLALSGFSTCCVPSGPDALEVLGGAVRFDVVLTEEVVPGLGGRDLVHAMRVMGNQTAVVILSRNLAGRFPPAMPPDEIVEEVPRAASSRELLSAVYRALHADHPAEMSFS